MMPADIARMRLVNQRLIGVPFSQPTDVVSWLGAVQAQDYAGAKWALAQRCPPGVTNAQIDALFNDGKILRTHVMRSTWHFVAPDDLRSLLKLTAPRVHQLNAYMYRKLELDAAIFRRSETVIEKALRGGHALTRDELGDILKKARIVASGHRLAYIAMHAELESLVCSGPLRGKQFTYALLEERAPEGKAFKREGALAELARRFFISHGPAQIQDFAWWSGLTVTDARAGLELSKDHLTSEVVDGKTFWFEAVSPKAVKTRDDPLVHLLPNYDELFIAYRDNRAAMLPEVLKRLKDDPDALGVHIIAHNGNVAGGWRRTVGKREILLTTNILMPFSKRDRAALTRAAEAYGRFMELPVKVLAP
ncbi:MAG: winged helix DNA-binding domain-containing protein [Nibricoccus sp.]